MTQFPQPTRPINSYDLEPMQQPQPPRPVYMDNMTYESSVPEERVPFQSTQPPTTASTEGREETVEELVRAIAELYAKLPVSIRSQVNLDKFHIPSEVQKGLKVDATISTRDLQGSVEELSLKLERFKIRTIDLGAVVKEEEEKQ